MTCNNSKLNYISPLAEGKEIVYPRTNVLSSFSLSSDFEDYEDSGVIEDWGEATDIQ